MNRMQYMEQLKLALQEFDSELRNEMLEDYEEHYAIGLQMGKTEEQISEELGDIQEMVKELRKLEPEKFTHEVESKTPEGSQEEREANVESESQFVDTHASEQTSQSSTNNHTSNQPKKIEIRSKIAHVQVIPSLDGQIHLDWANYEHSNAKDYYEFRSWVQGDTIYGEIAKRYSGLFAFGLHEIQLVIQVPKGFPEVNVYSLSGETYAANLDIQSMILTSASGSIEVKDVKADQLRLDTKSGSLDCNQIQSSNFCADTKSGDIDLAVVRSQSINARSLSGEVRSTANQSGQLVLASTSGDVESKQDQAAELDLSSISGDITVTNYLGNRIKLSSKSGDIEANVCVEEGQASTISGDIDFANAKDCKLILKAISGDLDINLQQCTGYTAELHTVSGDIDSSFHGVKNSTSGSQNITVGSGASRIQARSTSGDIVIRA